MPSGDKSPLNTPETSGDERDTSYVARARLPWQQRRAAHPQAPAAPSTGYLNAPQQGGMAGPQLAQQPVYQQYPPQQFAYQQPMYQQAGWGTNVPPDVINISGHRSVAVSQLQPATYGSYDDSGGRWYEASSRGAARAAARAAAQGGKRKFARGRGQYGHQAPPKRGRQARAQHYQAQQAEASQQDDAQDQEVLYITSRDSSQDSRSGSAAYAPRQGPIVLAGHTQGTIPVGMTMSVYGQYPAITQKVHEEEIEYLKLNKVKFETLPEIPGEEPILEIMKKANGERMKQIEKELNLYLPDHRTFLKGIANKLLNKYEKDPSTFLYDVEVVRELHQTWIMNEDNLSIVLRECGFKSIFYRLEKGETKMGRCPHHTELLPPIKDWKIVGIEAFKHDYTDKKYSCLEPGQKPDAKEDHTWTCKCLSKGFYHPKRRSNEDKDPQRAQPIPKQDSNPEAWARIGALEERLRNQEARAEADRDKITALTEELNKVVGQRYDA